MKKLIYVTTVLTVFMGLISCEELVSVEDFKVDKPVSVENQEEIDAYDALKTYAPDGFRLGATGVNSDVFTGQGVNFRLMRDNFSEISISSGGAYHGDFVNGSGDISVGTFENLVSLASDEEMSVYSPPLVWHQNQNADYLNELLEPIVIEGEGGGPEYYNLVDQDFESDDAPDYSFGGAAVNSFTADGAGADGTGRALIINNPEVQADDWRTQLFVTFEPATELDQVFILSMDIKADEAASFATQAHVTAGAYQHWDFFGTFNATTEWQHVEVEITVDANRNGCGAIAFNLGNTATNYYFDNISLRRFNPDFTGPTWEVRTAQDFETDDAPNYSISGAATASFSADGAGADGSGRAYIVNNPAVQADDWRSQFFVTFDPATALDERLTLSMDIKADEAASFTTQAHVTAGAYQHWDFFGTFNATTDWQHVEVEVTVDANRNGCGAIAFNLGNTATNYYFDNIELTWYNEAGGGGEDIIIEKTPEQKDSIISVQLEHWIAAMVGSSENVTAWEVIREPMDNDNPDELRSGDVAPESEFYWQDYLGKDYAKKAFSMARDSADVDDLLFISESGLESNLEKVQGLIDYIDYIEDGDAITVDGIAVIMHIDTTASQTNIATMFEELAATGKMIKISELNVALSDTPTEEALKTQAEMYKYVLDTYAAKVPAAQRYGVSIWNPIDDSNWEGLWNSQLTRKPAYKSFADGLESMK